MKKNIQNKKPAHIGGILENVLSTYRQESDAELIRIWEIWDQAVGDRIAQNAQPEAFKGKFLWVNVTHSGLIQELQFSKQRMITKINHALGKKMINDIKFKVGTI